METQQNSRKKTLKNLENWLIEQKLNPDKLISKLDKTIDILGYSGPPSIYWNFSKFFLVYFLYWTIILTLLTNATSRLTSFNNFKFILAEAICWSLIYTCFRKTDTKWLPLPPWESFKTTTYKSKNSLMQTYLPHAAFELQIK